MADEKKQDAGFLLSVQKVTSLSGESIQVSFNMSKEASEDEIYNALSKVWAVCDRRLVDQNEKVLKLTDLTNAAFDQLNSESKPN